MDNLQRHAIGTPMIVLHCPRARQNNSQRAISSSFPSISLFHILYVSINSLPSK